MKQEETLTLKYFSKEAFISKVENYMLLDKKTLAELLAFKDMLYSDEHKKWCPGIEAPSMLCDNATINIRDYEIEGTNITAQA